MALVDGVILAYHFNDNLATTNVIDASLNSDGTLGGGENTEDKSVAGLATNLDTALIFNGTDDFVDTNTAVSEASGSVSLWYKGTDVNQRIMSSIPTGTVPAGSIGLTTLSGGPNIRAEVVDNAGQKNAVSTSTVTDNAPHHIVMTWASGGNVKIYIDAILEDTVGLSTITPASVQNLHIMHYPRSNTFTSGAIDEPIFWNRELSQPEVTELRNSGNGNPYPFGAPSGWAGKIQGISPGKVQSIAVADIGKIQGVS
jgi:hypothetical protein